jgi:hypothetical protein
MKKISLLLGLGLSLFFASCDNDDDDDLPNPNVNFAATLNGASETPANASTATGSATGVYNSDTKILSVTTTYTGITPSAGHIHEGAVGVMGGVVFPFVAPLTSPIVYTSAPLDAGQETALMNGLYYVNLHTAAFPGGEIRGQLIKQ